MLPDAKERKFELTCPTTGSPCALPAVAAPRFASRPWTSDWQVMLESVAGFDWDAGNIEKCCKHGSTLLDVEALFRRGIDVYPDVAHSRAETRFSASDKRRRVATCSLLSRFD